MIQTPSLLFLGDAPDQLAAKVAQGIKDWRPENAVGQYRMPGCGADGKGDPREFLRVSRTVAFGEDRQLAAYQSFEPGLAIARHSDAQFACAVLDFGPIDLRHQG